MKRYRVLAITLFVFLGLSQSSCVRNLINKYKDPSAKRSSQTRTTTAQTRRPSPTAVKSNASGKAINQPTIYAVDKNRFRFRLPIEKVWDAALDVLLQNYNINIVDRKSAVITTEWDSFYLDSNVYRNKISIRMKNRSWDHVDVMIYNNVEVYKPSGANGLTSVWLPTERGPREVGRLLQNMAIALRQAPPVLPNEMIAGGYEASGRSTQ